MTATTNRVQKLVTFSPRLYFNAEVKAKQLGIPFAEYLRHLIIKDVEEDIEDMILMHSALTCRWWMRKLIDVLGRV